MPRRELRALLLTLAALGVIAVGVLAARGKLAGVGRALGLSHPRSCDLRCWEAHHRVRRLETRAVYVP